MDWSDSSQKTIDVEKNKEKKSKDVLTEIWKELFKCLDRGKKVSEWRE